MTSGLVLVILRGFLTLVLYAFFGMILYFLWQEIGINLREINRRRPTPIYLSQKDGENLYNHPFDLSEIIVGRDPACDYVLDDDTVSSRHSHLYFRQGHWWIEDLQSTNGTYLNEAQVKIPVVLTDNDLVRCGQAQILVRFKQSGQ